MTERSPVRCRLCPMLLEPATEADYPAIIELVNFAYRGTGPVASWNREAEILAGQRLHDSLLREELASKPEALLLTYRDDDRTLLGTVWLEPGVDRVWYLGLLTIRPDMQNRHLGRSLLVAAEEFARERGARAIKMTVIQARDTLLAWYQRRGYLLTGEIEPFPYDDERFGRPLRDDLHFVVLKKDL